MEVSNIGNRKDGVSTTIESGKERNQVYMWIQTLSHAEWSWTYTRSQQSNYIWKERRKEPSNESDSWIKLKKSSINKENSLFDILKIHYPTLISCTWSRSKSVSPRCNGMSLERRRLRFQADPSDLWISLSEHQSIKL